jgi:TrmH family RNA methyltransferase
MAELITSSRNPKIQQVRALLNQRSEREQTARFVIEGVRLCEEALNAGWLPEQVLVSPALSTRGKELAGQFKELRIPVDEIDQRLLERLSDTQTSQGILAVVPVMRMPIPANWDFLLILDGLRDPGNLGTVLRTAAAAGVQGVLLTPGTADPFAPKVVRAGMGAHFRLPIQFAAWEEIRQMAAAQQARIWVADVSRGEVCWQADFREPLALVIGSEAEGAQPAAYAAAGGLVHIPMPGASESLNAAVAASILIFEVIRQRSR